MTSLIPQDTIAAPASGDNGAVGIIRVSGTESFHILESLFFPQNHMSFAQIEERKMTFGYIKAQGHLIDEVLIALYKGPRSYTGEDMCEIFAHGGAYNLNRILDLILKSGARLAEKGEFTKRAFLNGKMDLTKAEAVNELIRADNAYAHQSAVKQLDGSLYSYLQNIRKKLIEMRAYFEAHIDYPEEDLETADFSDFRTYLETLTAEFHKHLQHLAAARMYQKGVQIALAGKTNVGKSSFLNFLLKTERAIVSDEHGTTRDAVSEQFFLKDLPVTLFDTAGLKADDSHIDKQAIAFTYRYIDQADFVIFMTDNSREWDEFDRTLWSYIQQNGKKTAVIINKIDLPKKNTYSDFQDVLEISLKDNINLDKIEDFLYSRIMTHEKEESFFIFSKRYETLFERFVEAAENLKQVLAETDAYDMILYNLEILFEILGSLTGEITTEDILDNIFSNFCVGK